MATVIDLLRNRGQGAAPGGAQALRGPIAIAPQPARAVTLAAPTTLVSAWTALARRQPEAGHALALAASRAGEAVAFMGYGSGVHDDLLLLTLADLNADSSSVALWLAPDARSARTAASRWEALSSSPMITWQMAGSGRGRRLPGQVVIATYDDVH